MDKPDLYNEISYSAAGINTPADQEDCTATDMISDAVEQIMDNIQGAVLGDSKNKES